MSTFARTAIAALLLGVFIVGGATVSQAADQKADRNITISAMGSMTAEPDQAHIMTGVLTEAATARDAVTRNGELMTKVIEQLKAVGIDVKDIRTSQFSVDPKYTNPRDGSQPVVNGYRVHNQVRIVARDLKRLGEVLDRVVAAGANQINSIQFEASQAETLRDEARKVAMANAIRRAKLYATAAGAVLGEVLHISEEVMHAGGPRPMVAGRMATMAAGAVPIETGSLVLEARVTATFALK